MAVRLDSHKVKDVPEWTPSDVREFIEAILPGHPCADFFTYTSGYVLCSLDKEDLRRQAKDEEAANVIWAELKACRKAKAAPRGAFAPSQDRGGLLGPSTITIYVRTRDEVAVEIEVLPSDMVANLKAQVAEREGTPVDAQRLVVNGMNMQDGRTLASYDVRHGTVVLLVPQIKENSKTTRSFTFAPRGMLMVPGSKSWQPSHPVRPYMPVICSDVSRSYPVSLEFETTDECDMLVQAAAQEPALLEIRPARRGQAPIETSVHWDPDTEGLRIDSSGNVLAPSMRYEAVAHLGGRGGEIRVTVVTGAAVA